MKYTFGIDTFDIDGEKDKARKLPEEAAEAFSAWEAYRSRPAVADYGFDPYPMPGTVEHVMYECCDAIQAACNLMRALGAAQEDVEAAMRAVHEHNHARGRY